MIGVYNKSVLLTYLGVCLSLFGIYFSCFDDHRTAFVCLIFAGICDLFDGPVARRFKRSQQEKEFGAQIDSLADVVSFLVFPSVLAVNLLGMRAVAVLLYVLAGIIRLAWFHTNSNKEEEVRYYQGLPVTYAALILPIYYLLYRLQPNVFWIQGFILVYLVTAVCFVLPIRIKKPGGIWYFIFLLLAIGVTAGIIMV